MSVHCSVVVVDDGAEVHPGLLALVLRPKVGAHSVTDSLGQCLMDNGHAGHHPDFLGAIL